ncbi:MAG: outer membrane protein assembly factor BamA [Rhodospirillales bacterium]|nr:outer membrane protein assembly factor BamA [Rhodospirillales bacterium]
MNPADTIQDIKVVGAARIDPGTIRSYMLVQPGDPFDPGRIDRSLKTLYATGLFQDVKLTREGGTLVVTVKENPQVNLVVFEGNHALSDSELRKVVQLAPRSVFSPAAAEADRKRILALYAEHAHYDTTVDPEIIRLSENRVNVVFKIADGPGTYISRIAFVGNKAFSETRLREVINSRQEVWWRFLTNNDQYDPRRIAYDKELLRRFYLKHGYVDFNISDATAELSPDRRAFFLTFTLHEGARYKLSKVTITSHLPHLNVKALKPDLELSAGDWYDGDAVGRIADKMDDDVRAQGIPFVAVKPEVKQDSAKHTIALNFDVTEGPRVYVQRIDIVGNTRTEDKVIRRQFQLAEGDAYNQTAVRESRQRLKDLGYFSNVDITTSPGSSPDKAILTTTVAEKATGSLTLGGGYSTDAGALVDIGLSENNLVGTGIAASINGSLAQKRTSIEANVTDPYFLDRNLVAGANVFAIQTYNLGVEPYDEKRVGTALSIGYRFNNHLRQSWTYSLVGRTVYNIQSGASYFIQDEAGYSLLSQLGQVLTLDYRDSKLRPHKGFAVSLGADFAGIGGNARFLRTRLDAAYYIPLDRITGNSDWGIKLSAGAGYLFNLGRQEHVIDRFFLGGDNLRGFEVGGAGPHDLTTGDSLGGRFIWTESQQLNFPLPVSPDLGLSGRAFVDVGGLTQGNFESNYCPAATGGVCPAVTESSAPRLGAGVGIAWDTSFGLINIDVTPFVIKQPGDTTQILRFGFGTRF